MASRALRRDDLCPGVRACGDVREVRCRACGIHWEPVDLTRSEPCPSCGNRGWIRQRCPTCELVKLDAAMDSEPGRLLMRAADLRSRCEVGMTVTADDLTAEEWRAIQVLEDERVKRDKEQPNGKIPDANLPQAIRGQRLQR